MGRRVVTGLVCAFVAGAPQSAPAAPAALAAEQWGAADLSVGISASPKVAQPGRPLVYRITVHNDGPGDAVLPVLRVHTPRDFQIVNVDVAECPPGRGADEVICRASQDVLAGGSGSMTITGFIRPGADGPLRAKARLSSEIVDSDKSDNTAETLTRVDEGTNLAVRFGRSTRLARPGRRFAVGAEVRNRGHRIVRDAYVFLQPREAWLESASGGRCRRRPEFVGCSLPTIKPGSSGLLHLVFRMPFRTSHAVHAMATVYSRRFGDRRPADNKARMRVALRRD